jgi:hypothetical protein
MTEDTTATLPIKSYTGGPITVEAIEYHDNLAEALRNSEWIDGNLRLLTYPTAAPVAVLGDEPPLSLNGRVLADGNYLVKGPAGDFDILPAATFHMTFPDEVAA